MMMTPSAPAWAQTFAAAAPIPELPPVIRIIFPFWEFAGLVGSIAGYGSRRGVLVTMNGSVNWSGLTC